MVKITYKNEIAVESIIDYGAYLNYDYKGLINGIDHFQQSLDTASRTITN